MALGQGAKNSADLTRPRWILLSATVICVLLAVAFALVGVWLVFGGLASVLGAIFVGHLEATGIILLLGFISLLASTAMFALAIVFVGRYRESQPSVPRRRAQDKGLPPESCDAPGRSEV